MGQAIPPLVILKGKNYLSSWYEDISKDWAIGVSENGWIINALGIEWLEHFDKHTKDRSIGTRQMLILDGYESYNLLEFLDLYKEKGIITLCMLAHALYLLQPLDVGCFSPLKKAYGNEVGCLIYNRIHYINKLSFLLAFKAAFKRAFIKDNIYLSF